MEFIVTFRVPKGAPFLTSIAFVNLTGSSTISVRLVAVGTIVTESFIMRAVLPADGSDSGEARLAVRVAKSTILLFISGTR